MNIIQMQDRLKDLSDNQLRTYVENPHNMQGSGVGQGGTSGGYVPTYLVLGEMKRRKDSRSKYEGEKAQQKTTKSKKNWKANEPILLAQILPSHPPKGTHYLPTPLLPSQEPDLNESGPCVRPVAAPFDFYVQNGSTLR